MLKLVPIDKPMRWIRGCSKEATLRQDHRTYRSFSATDLAWVKSNRVIRAAGLRVGAGHVEAAKRMRADHGARALAIEIEIADVELAACVVQLAAVAV